MATLPKAVMFTAMGGVVVGVFIEVLMRYVLSTPLFGIGEVITLCAAYLYFFGIAYVSYEKSDISHIRVDILGPLIKNPLVAKTLEWVNLLVCLIVCCTYSCWAIKYCYWVGINGQRTPDIGYPRIFLVVSIMVGFLLMTVYFVLHFLNMLSSKGQKP